MSIDVFIGSPGVTAFPEARRAQFAEVFGPPVPASGASELDDRRESAGVDRAWDGVPPLRLDAHAMERSGVVTATRSDDRHIPFDILRTKLMKMMRQNGWRTLAITSPTAQCGKTTIALNLAFSLARQSDFRLALLDFNLRRPGIAPLLKCQRPYSVDRFLRGHRSMAQSLLRHDKSLVIAPNTAPVEDAAELLQDLVPGTAIPAMREALGLDLVIFDLPPMLETDDVLSVLPAVDCVLLVAGANQTTMSEIDVCERDLAEQGKFLGLVLNKCRFTPEKYGY
jgi:Mrp family chromosome partitioning ATPase